MSERDLIAAGFQPSADGSLRSPGCITLMPTDGGKFYRVVVKLPSGATVTCHVARIALKVEHEEVRP